ncbi:MAG TPA: polysaccharide biosynthesis tyrosine autokinase [Terriglobia bacterium]|nr:polysaccharide biosynthesis tyrosine autokinase [Terriglobia bacterium]
MSDSKDLIPAGSNLPERDHAWRFQAQALEPDNSDVSSFLRTYWHILLKRRRTVAAVTFVATTLAAIYAFKSRPVYQAVSKVAVEAETPQIQTVQDLYQSRPTDTMYLATQVDVLRSDDLAWKTIEQLHLDQNVQFNPAARSAGMDPGSPDAVKAELIQAFKGRLKVDLLQGTSVIQVAFESFDPALAARVVNTLVNNYTEYNFLTKYDATRQASAWMEQRLDELKDKVEKSQQALVNYEQQHSIVDLGNRENVMEQRLGSLTQDLTDAQNDLAQKQSLYQLAEANPKQAGILVQDQLLQQLQQKYGDLQTDYVNALAQYGPNFPKVVRLREQIREVGSLMDQEQKQVLERLRHDYLAALGREKILSAAVDQEKAEIGKASQLLIQENILKHEFQTNEDLYDNLLMHVKNATVSAGLHANNVHVIDHALVPTHPVRPQKGVDIAVGFLAGLMLGITIAFAEEGLDNSVKNAEDVERHIPVPALAVIPAAATVEPHRGWLAGGGKASPLRGVEVALMVTKAPTSPLAEAFRTLRTSVLLSTAPRPPQTVLISSAQPGEGKTSTALNLALSLAQRGGQVLIVDADLRKPGVARALGLKEKKGLSGVLTGAYGLDEALVRIENLNGLWVLASGPHPPNPAELLSSPTMEQLLKELCRRFNHVVLDSPPLLALTDAIVLSTLVDGVVLVVESGVTPRNALVRSFRMLQDTGSRVLGTVVNKMDLRIDGYYGYSYRRYYGSDYFKGTSDAETALGPTPDNAVTPALEVEQPEEFRPDNRQ